MTTTRSTKRRRTGKQEASFESLHHESTSSTMATQRDEVLPVVTAPVSPAATSVYIIIDHYYEHSLCVYYYIR